MMVGKKDGRVLEARHVASIIGVEKNERQAARRRRVGDGEKHGK